MYSRSENLSLLVKAALIYSAIVSMCVLTLASGAALAESTPQLSAEKLFAEGAPAIPSSSATTAAPQLPALTQLVKALKGSVVNISVEGESEAAGEEAKKNERSENKEPHAASGSGFIIHTDGYIVTSNHVIDKSKKITVRLPDDKTDYSAEVLGQDAKTDIALIKIDAPHKLPAVFVGDSDALEVGEWVVAIGNQFQLGQTVTAGIVSATSRRVPNGSAGPYDAFIQTDASINPGSSGGPLFNTRGQVVGINTAIFSPGRSQFGGTGFNIGIGFAIPINLAREVLTQLKEGGRVRRGLLGVLIQKIDADVASVLSLAGNDGALVADVMPSTPAARAGVMRKDVITSFNGVAVKDHDDLPLMVARTPIGATVPVVVVRGAKTVSLSVTISELTDTPSAKESEEQPDATGLLVESVSQERAESLSLTAPFGVRVLSVESGSVAEKAGLLKDDIIVEASGRTFKDGAAWRDFVRQEFVPEAKQEKLFLILVKRKQGTRYVVIKRPVSPQLDNKGQQKVVEATPTGKR
jgi:serine protease Do